MAIYESVQMKEKFNKSELMAATRQILTEIAAWSETLFGQGAAERLTGLPPGRDPEYDDSGAIAYIERIAAVQSRDWTEAGCAGAAIENSTTLLLISKAIDYLNTNIWQGDAEDFWLSYIALFPLYQLLENNWHRQQGEVTMALQYAVDDALDRNAAKTLYQAMREFSTRAVFERRKSEVTISELAVISGLSEKTVRMAAIGQDKSPDLVTFKDGRMTLVKIDEARRWMASKNIDYQSPKFTEAVSLPLVEPSSLAELGAYLRKIRLANNISLEDLAQKLNWSKKLKKAYQELEMGLSHLNVSQFSTKVLMELANAVLPTDSRELVEIIDRVLHPLQLEQQIAQIVDRAQPKP
jgi:transcriptional regulator with XRE-family HTH domain